MQEYSQVRAQDRSPNRSHELSQELLDWWARWVSASEPSLADLQSLQALEKTVARLLEARYSSE